MAPVTRSTYQVAQREFMSRFYVQLHHGHIAVESRMGEGSRFIVRLPKDPAAARS